jgi:hypothetical protein
MRIWGEAWEARLAERREAERRKHQQRAARAKHIRQILNERGFYAVLRQLAEGGDAIGREAQLRILKVVEDTVQHERRSRARRKPRNLRLEKIEALMRDPSATPGERTAAQEAAARLRTRRP